MPVQNLKAQIAHLPEQPGVYLYANAAGARRWGRGRQEILGVTWQELDLPAAARDALGQLGEDLFHFLAVEYLWRRHALAYHAGRLLTLVRAPTDVDALAPPLAGSGEGSVVRHPAAPPRLASFANALMRSGSLCIQRAPSARYSTAPSTRSSSSGPSFHGESARTVVTSRFAQL